MADIKSGFYVTELMGMGVNGLTGDYSRGAAGFWIENGALAFPVSEMTVAGNLNDMFARLVAANDLEFRTGADSPDPAHRRPDRRRVVTGVTMFFFSTSSRRNCRVETLFDIPAKPHKR